MTTETHNLRQYGILGLRQHRTLRLRNQLRLRDVKIHCTYRRLWKHWWLGQLNRACSKSYRGQGLWLFWLRIPPEVPEHSHNIWGYSLRWCAHEHKIQSLEGSSRQHSKQFLCEVPAQKWKTLSLPLKHKYSRITVCRHRNTPSISLLTASETAVDVFITGCLRNTRQTLLSVPETENFLWLLASSQIQNTFLYWPTKKYKTHYKIQRNTLQSLNEVTTKNMFWTGRLVFLPAGIKKEKQAYIVSSTVWLRHKTLGF